MASPVSLDQKATASPIQLPTQTGTVVETAGIARFEYGVTTCEMLADFIAVMLGTVFSYWLYRGLGLGKHLAYGAREHIAVVVGFAIFFVLMLDRAGAYHPGNSLLRVKETERILRTSALSFLLIFPITFFAQLYFSRWLFLIGLVSVPFFVCMEKHGLYSFVRMLHARGYGVRKVVIYGAGHTGRRVFSALVRSPKLGLNPIAFIDDDNARLTTAVFELGYQHRRSAPVLQGPPTEECLRRCGATQLVIAIPSLSRDNFLKVVSEAFAAGAKVSFVPNYSVPGEASVDHADIDGLLLSSVGKIDSRPGYEFVKRILDAFLAAVLLVLLAPLLIFIAVLVRYDSEGPSFFIQHRVGRNGRIFTLYKFRTMLVDTPAYDYCPRDSSDVRVTRIGRFLRRTSLDELPQLFNVLKGEMSLVGPRPEMPFIVETYTPRHRQRLRVTPGLTGLWQLSGDRAYLIHENVEYDLYYIKNRSLFMDLAILMHTIFFAMRGV
jgi:exopolysaccharide biosynthesis polyprenyl glycosylphosphotransferase